MKTLNKSDLIVDDDNKIKYIEKYMNDPEFRKQEQLKSEYQSIQDKIELYKEGQEAINPFIYIPADELTETKITKIISKLLKGTVLYCELEKTWYIWNGKKWIQDIKNEIIIIIQNAIKRLYSLAAKVEKLKDKKIILNYLVSCESRYRLKNILELLKAKLPVTPNEFDSDSWLINCQNGILNLKTMEIIPHDSGYKMTKIINCDFDKSAACPEWEKFLSKIFLNRASLMDYLKRVFGLSLVGEIIEHILIIFHGRGANGKTTLLNTIIKILGNYVDNIPVETFLSSKFDNTRFNTYLLVGKRMIITIEPDKHRYLKEGTIKQLTGGDNMTVEKKFCMPFSFKPQCTIFLACNVEPQITGQDYGIWRRIKKIPFDYQIKDDERINNFDDILIKEKEGIFLWMVTGLLEYVNDGLREPDIITKAIEDYKSQEDILTDFYNECCVFEGEIKSSELYKKYRDWAERTHEKKPFSQRGFSIKLKEKGFKKDDHRRDGNYWLGISIKSV